MSFEQQQTGQGQLSPAAPPFPENWEGEPRQVGVEIEFATVSPRQAAECVQEIFGGDIKTLTSHRIQVTGTSHGDFQVELDSQYIHRLESPQESPILAAQLDEWLRWFQSSLGEIVGELAATVIPCEIVCPPMSLADMHLLDATVDALNRRGATGTRENPLYAFGAQLNPDIAQKDAAYVTAILKAYLLLSPWLREVIAVDMTRRVFAFADPFPKTYMRRVTATDYWPGFPQLIDDYVWYNPTRNRELDLLPLFAWLDEPRVRAAVTDTRVKSRPTFHYRLPDANFGMADWTITREWNRWVEVERLAADADKLRMVCDAYAEHERRFFRGWWSERVADLLALPGPGRI
ncbi:amidoligase family protein [Dichotomicrobium thermohalophilum]|uniref:Putative amidoligase enzyme n=1 Tax=Dichotomicrobium thermohalophilum TaxID=933063 RepID=A0A397PI61_9HYPH|nr:amidoligase family protein [Dichotomicrobium thermohalophilum]RIA47569.1 putative amidoligase enzyme [Dichotomicrobium thermohalophilum]